MSINMEMNKNNENKENEQQNIWVENYRILKKIGSGAYGEIYAAEDQNSGARVAIKLEDVNTMHPKLKFEYKLYKHLDGVVGVPKVYRYFNDKLYNVMVLELLGPSLEDLFSFCNRRLTEKTVLMLAPQMIARVESLHLKKYVHRDIKPDNFLMGNGEHNNYVFIIDLGLAKRYYSDSDDTMRKTYLTGTARYASLNAHSGNQQSRRDDMESMGYVFIYFLKGSLPWQGIKARTRSQKYELIAEKKLSTTLIELCNGLSNEFFLYIDECRKMLYNDAPRYTHWRNTFLELFESRKYARDSIYDWKAIKIRTDEGEQSQKKRKITEQTDINAIIELKDD